MLQLDMLAYLHEADEPPHIVVGAGVPPTWIDHPLEARGLSLRSGRVDWEWDGRALHVRVKGERIPVRPAPVFPADCVVEVEYVDYDS